MRKFLLILAAAIVAVALVSCGGSPPPAPTGYAPGQTAVAYAYVHGGYVGEAVVTTGEGGTISVRLDEAFLPHTLAIVSLDAAEWTEENTVYYVQRGNQVRVAKHISYAGKNYVGATVGSSVTYVEADEDGNPAGGLDLELIIIRNQNTMRSYFENLRAGAFAVHTEFGGTAMPVTTTSYGSLFKRGSSYWPQGIGWMGNIEAVEAAAVQHGLGYNVDQMVRGSDNRWKLADAVTGATLSDFIDYFTLVQAAAGRLRME